MISRHGGANRDHVISTADIVNLLSLTYLGSIDSPFKGLFIQSSSIYLADMSTHNGKSWKQMSKSDNDVNAFKLPVENV